MFFSCFFMVFPDQSSQKCCRPGATPRTCAGPDARSPDAGTLRESSAAEVGRSSDWGGLYGGEP